MTDAEILLHWQAAFLKRFENGDVAVVQRMLFTWAILAELTDDYYGDRWCYKTKEAAIRALLDWDGEGEPQGWHRHPDSGRRVDADGKMHVHF